MFPDRLLDPMAALQRGPKPDHRPITLVGS
jgi:hypothetical protein